MKIRLSTIKSFVWRTAFIMLVLVLFTTHFVSGLAARYVTSSSGDDSARVAKFSYSAKINGVSALSFTNTNFWSHMDGELEDIAMNALRSIDMTVNNFREDNLGNKLVSEVATRYALEFVMPVNFAQDLAFQLLDSGGNALLPQINMTNLLTAMRSLESYNTANDAIDYQSVPTGDVTFTTTKKNENIYTATASNGTTITIESLTRQNVMQTLFFRVWDVALFNKPNVEEEGGDLVAPLEIDYKSDLECLKVSISMPDFTFPANEAGTESYKVMLVPTIKINDDLLGADVYDTNTNKKADSLFTDQQLTFKQDGFQMSITALEVRHGENKYTKETPFNLFSGGIQKYLVSISYSKTYPMQVKALFEQID